MTVLWSGQQSEMRSKISKIPCIESWLVAADCQKDIAHFLWWQ
ncbi:MAG: hypothetical protein PVF37_18090 [Desulfobacterales bacterium]|jgi:hypothetical protein